MNDVNDYLVRGHLKRIERALIVGGRLHAFLSGGGLRVINIEKEGAKRSIAYGEAPEANEAFRILVDDYEAGGRAYASVYGKIEKHYLTGSSAPQGRLDVWLRQGHTFNAWHETGEFVFELRGLEESRPPPDTVKRCTAGETISWTDDRRVTYECRPSRFPNGELCCSTRIVSKPEGMPDHRAWLYYATQVGHGASLHEAIDAAFAAPKHESTDQS